MTPWKRKEVIGDATLYLGDCLEILPTLGKVDAVITDPPYDAMTHDGALVDINFPPLPSVDVLAPLLLSVSRRWCLAFCSLEMLFQYKAAAGKAWIRAGVWDRVQNMPQMSGDRPAQACEGLAIMHQEGRKVWNGGGQAAIYRHPVERGNKEHPTQKPASLLNQIMGLFTNDGETILDPFMGSGTTGVACANLGRKFIGIEIEPKYYEIACQRIENAQRQQSLLDPYDQVTQSYEQVKLL